MKKEKLLKLILDAIMAVVLLGMSINVFAATTNDDVDIIDITNTIGTNTNTATGSGTGVNLNTNTGTNSLNTNLNTGTVNTTNNYNTNLPHTGIAENTMLGVALTVLVIIAIYAYRKVKYYTNI